jgi:23S rRNA pseudouridine2605 synthase
MSDRIAKIIARAGVCSRRDAEKLIFEGRVKVKGEVVTTPAIKLENSHDITIDNKPIKTSSSRLWLYHKPKGLITSHKDENNRPTVFENLPRSMPRVISIGRLDYNTEGLLLLTNDGELSRKMELPSSGIVRRYRVRLFGKIDIEQLERLKNGITIDNIKYKPMELTIKTDKANNNWLDVAITEGKNREIRKIFEHFGLQVTRLIRTSYGDYELGDLPVGQVREVSSSTN